MSIIPLISSWEQFVRAYPDGDLQQFGRWLQFSPTSQPATTPANPAPLKPKPPTSPANPAPPILTPLSPQPDILQLARQSLNISAELDAAAYGTLLVNRLGMINLFLSKPIIRKLGFTKDAEFGVLVQVFLMDRPNKKEICRRLLIETSTGVEITRRLAKRGLLQETIDPNDRRSARLSVTEKGMRLIKEGYAYMAPIHRNFLTPLPPEEQLQLVGMLARLHNYHSARIDNNDNP